MSVKFGFTAKQIIAEGRITEEEIDFIRKWSSNENLPKLTEEQIVIFLLSCDKDQEATKNTILAYYSLKNGAPHVFNDRELQRKDLHQHLQVAEYCVLPERTDDGCAIICARLYDTYFRNIEMAPAMKLLFMTLDAALHDNPPTGLIIIYDMKGVGLMHLTRVRLGLVKLYFDYLQQALPIKLKMIHILNTVYFIDKVMAIMKPFVSKSVLDRMQFHPINIDMEAFHQNWVPKRSLPEDYGGDLPSVRVLHEQNTEKLTKMQGHFEAEELQRRSLD